MSKDFDDLISKIKAMDVTPDPRVRAAHIAAAEKKFKSTQEISGLARPIDNPSLNRGSQQAGEWIMAISKKLKRTLFLGSTGLVTASAAAFLVLPKIEQVHQHEVLVTPPLVQHVKPSGKVVADKIESFGVSSNANTSSGYQSTKKSFAPAMVMSREMMSPSMPHSSDMIVPIPLSNDKFEETEQGGVSLVSEAPVSTFSIDVDTASYATLRSYLSRGDVLSADALRIEEMINYFSYDYAAPAPGGHPFSVDAVNFETPWNAGTEIVRIGLQGIMPEIDARPPLDLVFLIDTSGSMRSPEKLGLLKQSLKMMLPQMREGDRIGIVAYAGSAGVKLEMTSATERSVIEAALEDLSAGGSTAGAAGLKAAYSLIEASTDDDRIGRVILATDGDFNVGMSSAEEMKSFIEKKRDTGAYLSVLGFGRGNYNDALMQTLAQNGNGQAAYIDTLSEARKVLVDQLSGALFPIAGDVKVQVEFNPNVISEYRLIGYETRALKREDFKNDKVDAGDIGAGHQVTAIYEVTPVGSDSSTFEASRYGDKVDLTPNEDDAELGFLRLRYKAPGKSDSRLIEVPISRAQEEMSEDDAFVASVAGWGQHMKGAKYLENWSMGDAIDLARSGRGEDLYGYRSEAIKLMELYEAISR